MRRQSARLYVLIVSICSSVVFLTALVAQTEFNYPAVANDGDYTFYRGPDPADRLPQIEHWTVRNVIFMIGDGMGLAQVALARDRAVGPAGKLHMDTLPVNGLIRTHAADNIVTDSAAAGTALACGVKTNNKMIGMTPDGTRFQSLLEAAQGRGMRSGLVATSTITHATPASFASHVRARSSEARIAEQLLQHRVNVLFGGGRHFFIPKKDKKSKRRDNRDLLMEARQEGYAVIDSKSQMKGLTGDYVLGLFNDGGLTTKDPEPSLAFMTQQALDLLTKLASPEQPGFFLMVEGSQIDWAGHDNDVEGCIRQTLLFDQAIETALNFAARDRHTLIVITADHETGGLTLPADDSDSRKLVPRWSTKHHTGIPVPVYAFGPGAEHFAGIQDNTDIPKKIARLLDIQSFPRVLERQTEATTWESLFNGKDLDGWKGDPNLWSVQDGVILGTTSDERPLPYNTFLIWEGEPVENFELTLKLSMIGNNNSGIQYRSRELTDQGAFVVGGYQMDIHPNPPYCGMLYEERGRGILAQRPTRVVIEANGEKRVEETLGEATPIDLEAWNEYTIIAQGNHLVHKINGAVTVDITDRQADKAATSGIIALQLHRGPAMKLRVKDIRLKQLP